MTTGTGGETLGGAVCEGCSGGGSVVVVVVVTGTTGAATGAGGGSVVVVVGTAGFTTGLGGGGCQSNRSGMPGNCQPTDTEPRECTGDGLSRSSPRATERAADTAEAALARRARRRWRISQP